ncbi:hypothetical protein RM863_11585 [Streptomyces sp. DSM 41014]|uniref:Uncharacterized protein n=1 Tax=Streptomyces hintoniae TaxID=3075521 RepID=A0ABU2UHT2_9ACTN|nr:hypothetical protein [Streptomyces sp. DSM 41014]MDT0472769.1 hypothetical protein [Streptomyces sp. DSM 41014]
MARVAYNALSFLPARSMVQTARVDLGPTGLRITGTNGYAVGQDTAPVEEYRGPTEGLTVHVDRGVLAALDTGGRKDKRGFGRFELRPGDGLIFRPANNDIASAGQDVTEQADPRVWSLLDELFTRLEGRPPSLPELVAFDPALLAMFSKVKAPKVRTGDSNLERALDMAIFDSKEPILIKIGPTFRGVIVPIDRDVHEENVGPEGLW